MDEQICLLRLQIRCAPKKDGGAGRCCFRFNRETNSIVGFPMQDLKIVKLSKQFADESSSILVLDGLDLEVPAASIVSIEGVSGSGKSTLLNIVGTMDSPSSGYVKYGKQKLNCMSEGEKEKFRARQLGFVFQHYYLLPDFTILENTMMPLLISKQPWAEARKKSEDLLEMVALSGRKAHFPARISGGEMARAGLARALVGGNKSIVLADEPTGNLDAENSNHLADLLWDLQKKLSFTLIIVTHDQDFAARIPVRYRLHLGKLNPILG